MSKFDEQGRVRTSKAMSWVLRHAANRVGVPMRPDGFVLVEDLLKVDRLRGCSFEDIQYAVEHCEKQRFQLRRDDATSHGDVNQDNVSGAEGANVTGRGWIIRANQGHSIKTVADDLLLDEIAINTSTYSSMESINEAFPLVIHGTEVAFLNSILFGSRGSSPSTSSSSNSSKPASDHARNRNASQKQAAPRKNQVSSTAMPAGLSRCSRKHVHFAAGFPDNFDASAYRSVMSEYRAMQQRLQSGAVGGSSTSVLDVDGKVAERVSSQAASSAAGSSSVGSELSASATATVAVEAAAASACSSAAAGTDRDSNAARQPVHAVKSGMRRNSTAIVLIDMGKAVAGGVPFYRSSNGVILSPGVEPDGIVPTEYISDILVLKNSSFEVKVPS